MFIAIIRQDYTKPKRDKEGISNMFNLLEYLKCKHLNVWLLYKNMTYQLILYASIPSLLCA